MIRKINLLLFVFVFGCQANPKAINYEFDSMVIYVLTPSMTIVADGDENALNLKKNFTYKIYSKDNFNVNKYLQSIGVDDLKKCQFTEYQQFPQLLIEAKKGNNNYIFSSDGKILTTLDFKFCINVTSDIIENFAFFSHF